MNPKATFECAMCQNPISNDGPVFIEKQTGYLFCPECAEELKKIPFSETAIEEFILPKLKYKDSCE